jgi:hypothetical protein
MVKLKWVAYREVFFYDRGHGCTVPCMLVAIDFDKETMTLRPFPDGWFEPEDFTGNIRDCELPKYQKLKVTKRSRKPIEP